MRDPVRSRTRVSAPPDTLRSALTRRATNIVLSPGAHHASGRAHLALVVIITPSRRARLASGRTQHIALSTLPAPGAHLASGRAQHIAGNTPGARLVGGRCRSLPRPLAGRGRGS